MAHLTDIFRHPIKAHGAERLDTVHVKQGHCLPFDRIWAVAHTEAKLNGNSWSHCFNFSRAARTPCIHAITCTLAEGTQTVTLRHPDRKDFTFQPDDERQLSGFLAWVKPLMDPDRVQSDHIIRVEQHGMTDTKYPSVSLNNHTSRRILEQHTGVKMQMQRFRGNLWADGLAPFEEHEWVGKKIRIGTAVFEGVAPIERCMAIHASSDTGVRDADTLGTLEQHYGHRDFGLAMTVIENGTVTIDDKVELV